MLKGLESYVFSPALVTLRFLSLLLSLSSSSVMGQEIIKNEDTLQRLGRSLYFDTAFSNSRELSCASCHDPAVAFVDSRALATFAPVSVGDNGASLGSRNAPTLSYVALSPEFENDDNGIYKGGFFLDGRAPMLERQALGPLLHPDEMAMPSEAAVLERLLENPDYVQAYQALFGKESIEDEKLAVMRFGEAIAAFERSDYFAPFDSKYDRYLRGEYKATVQEQVGIGLFFSPDFSGCSRCHQLQSLPRSTGESFSNYMYENIGVPANPMLASSGAVPSTWLDLGLADNPMLSELTSTERKQQRGKFKVPTLRNVALTGPYMHNGVFQDLRTVIKFYNKYNAFTQQAKINPETQQEWAAAEVSDNIALDKLRSLFLTEPQIDALMAFLKMLTDKRFDHLIE